MQEDGQELSTVNMREWTEVTQSHKRHNQVTLIPGDTVY